MIGKWYVLRLDAFVVVSESDLSSRVERREEEKKKKLPMLLDVYAYLAFFFVGSYKAIIYIYTVTYKRPSSFYGPNVPLHSHFSVSQFPVPISQSPFSCSFFFPHLRVLLLLLLLVLNIQRPVYSFSLSGLNQMIKKRGRDD